MRKANLKEIEERERQSPTGKFGRASKDISPALGYVDVHFRDAKLTACLRSK